MTPCSNTYALIYPRVATHVATNVCAFICSFILGMVRNVNDMVNAKVLDEYTSLQITTPIGDTVWFGFP